MAERSITRCMICAKDLSAWNKDSIIFHMNQELNVLYRQNKELRRIYVK